MFGNLINRILGLETDSPGHRSSEPPYCIGVVKAEYHTEDPVPEKYQRDIEALRPEIWGRF